MLWLQFLPEKPEAEKESIYESVDLCCFNSVISATVAERSLRVYSGSSLSGSKKRASISDHGDETVKFNFG